MKAITKKPLAFPAACLVLGLTFFSSLAVGQPNAASRAAAANIAVAEMPIPESVFNIPASAQQGRNPFFPDSQAAVPVVKTNLTSTLDTSTLVLNGITSPPKRMAMINGRSFERGEAGDVRLQNGVRIPVECLDILDDRVIIKVNGIRRELQLRTKY
jgi:hypothetical protein